MYLVRHMRGTASELGLIRLILLPRHRRVCRVCLNKISTQSYSAKLLYWGDHVNSVPDLAASPPGDDNCGED